MSEMAKQAQQQGDDQFWDLMEHACSTMERIEQHIDEHNEAGLKRREITNLLIRGITLFLVILAFVNLYLLVDLDRSMRSIVLSMDEMTGHFSKVAEEMVEVTTHTSSIGEHMNHLPSVEQSMAGITVEMDYMDRSIKSIDYSLTSVNIDLGAIDGNMIELNGRLYNLNQNVGVIRYDMHKISKPARFMNNFLP